MPRTKVDDKTFPVLPTGTPDKVSRLLCQMLRFEVDKRPSALDICYIINTFLQDEILLQEIEQVWRKRKTICGDFEYKTFDQAMGINSDNKNKNGSENNLHVSCLDFVFNVNTITQRKIKTDIREIGLEIRSEDFKYDDNAIAVHKVVDAH